MFLHVEKAKYIKDYKVWLSFNDGIEGVIDLSSELYGEIFEPLKDVSYFKSFTLDGHTLTWNNGADFALSFYMTSLPDKTLNQSAVIWHFIIFILSWATPG